MSAVHVWKQREKPNWGMWVRMIPFTRGDGKNKMKKLFFFFFFLQNLIEKYVNQYKLQNTGFKTD